ncbi:phosphatidylinositol-specific phospholipase C domain-containing protein [Enterococcus faecalis]|uniref:phosphatidylinositol-specific phospholipase C domain-containing protein n=1 Tax=Enterococcus faecalis TaxID=1351 RepID=UPI0035EEAE77
MEHGIRFFDIRGRTTKNNQIVSHHGPKYLFVTLHEFLREAKYFFNDHPSETLLCHLKRNIQQWEKLQNHLWIFLKIVILTIIPFTEEN